MIPSRPAARGMLACAVALLLLGSAYQIKGNRDLVFGTTPGDAVDLRSRDFEQLHFERGENPFDYMTASQPPWGYQAGLLLTWPPWPAVRWYFAVLNAAALAFLLWWAYREPADAPSRSRLLVMAAVFAFGGSCTATEVGQVSIIVTALLAGALLCDRHNRPWLCGLLVALAMIKPTIAAPFAVALLLTRRFKAAAMAAAYGAVATAITWWVVGASPLRMLRQLAAAASGYIGDGTIGIADGLAAFGASPAGVALTPLLVAVPAAALIIVLRPTLPIAFAVAAVWGRLWTYHKSYDDIMMALLLVPLGVLAFGGRRSRAAAVAFFAIGVLEWLPAELLATTPIQVAQLIVWPAALVLLLRLERSSVSLVNLTIPRPMTARDQPAL